MLNKLFNMHNKLILNKLFICLIKYELISYVNYFLLKKYLKNSFLNALKVTLLCEAMDVGYFLGCWILAHYWSASM